MIPRVVDIHPVGRWLLLNLIILPVRPARSAEAYRKVWTKEGSPLLVYSRQLTAAVAQRLQGEYEVELAMRYGNPSIPSAVARAALARGARVHRPAALSRRRPRPPPAPPWRAPTRCSRDAWDVAGVRVVPAFHDHPGFLDAFAEVARPVIAEARADHVLFSYHGLPERHMRKSDPSGRHCLASATCCDVLSDVNRHCYRAQCYATSRGLAERLGLSQEGYSVSFQSRLGRTPWIRPYTDLVLPELAQARREAAGGDVPGLRRRLPRDAGGGGHARPRAVPRVRGRVADARPLAERPPGVGGDGGPPRARGGRGRGSGYFFASDGCSSAGTESSAVSFSLSAPGGTCVATLSGDGAV